VFYVGKINPAKLANFAEIDVFVLVASPENTAGVDPAESLSLSLSLSPHRAVRATQVLPARDHAV